MRYLSWNTRLVPYFSPMNVSDSFGQHVSLRTILSEFNYGKSTGHVVNLSIYIHKHNIDNKV